MTQVVRWSSLLTIATPLTPTRVDIFFGNFSIHVEAELALRTSATGFADGKRAKLSCGWFGLVSCETGAGVEVTEALSTLALVSLFWFTNSLITLVTRLGAFMLIVIIVEITALHTLVRVAKYPMWLAAEISMTTGDEDAELATEAFHGTFIDEIHVPIPI